MKKILIAFPILIMCNCLSFVERFPNVKYYYQDVPWPYVKTIGYLFENKTDGIYSLFDQYMIIVIKDGESYFFVRTKGLPDVPELYLIGSFNKWEEPGIHMDKYKNSFWYKILKSDDIIYCKYFDPLDSNHDGDRYINPHYDQSYIDYPFGSRHNNDLRRVRKIRKLDEDIKEILVAEGLL